MKHETESDAPTATKHRRIKGVARALTFRPNAEGSHALRYLRGELGPNSGESGYSTNDILNHSVALYAQLVAEARHRGTRVLLQRGDLDQVELVMPGMLPDLPFRDDADDDWGGGSGDPDDPPVAPRSRDRQRVPSRS